MSNKILPALVLTIVFFQIGCSGSKKEKIEKAQVQAAVNACIFDPTGQCQARAKLVAENPHLASQINQVGATSVQNGGTGVVQKTGSGNIVPVLPQSITDADIKAQAMKVQSAIAADSNNPRSLHYDPAQSQVVADRTPAATSSTSEAASSSMAPSSTGFSSASNGTAFQ